MLFRLYSRKYINLFYIGAQKNNDFCAKIYNALWLTKY